MMIVWLLVGIIAVSLAYLLPSEGLDPWIPLNAAGVLALAYLAALMAVTTRRPFPRRSKALSWVVFLIVGGAIAFAWTGFDAQAHFQAQQLSQIRQRIARNAFEISIFKPSLSLNFQRLPSSVLTIAHRLDFSYSR